MRNVVLGGLVFLLVEVQTEAQMSGAIWTSTKNGALVNGNVYSNEKAVYLSGGPGATASCSASGLPDGNYYFQVTDPSGSTLLSSDLIFDREFVVSNGVISSYAGSHSTGNGACGSTTIQLDPYDDTPSPGKVHKVWVTPVAQYDPLGSGFFGFSASQSKTDNFKLKSPGPPQDQSIIAGFAFYDFNENGVWDASVPEEVPLAGWRVELWLNGTFEELTYADVDGSYEFLRNQDGAVYTVLEIAPPPGYVPLPGGIWVATTPTMGDVTADMDTVPGPLFGNFALVNQADPVTGAGPGLSKGFWHSGNGKALLQPYDPMWRDVLNGPPTDPVCLRDNDGSIFTVSTTSSFDEAFDAWSNFVVGNPALGVAGFMLSSQLGPALLNNNFGNMQGTIYVDRFQDGVLVDFQVMVAGAVSLLCDPDAYDTSPDTPFQELRDAMLNCFLEFSSVNETGSSSNPQVVFGPASGSPDIPSPY